MRTGIEIRITDLCLNYEGKRFWNPTILSENAGTTSKLYNNCRGSRRASPIQHLNYILQGPACSISSPRRPLDLTCRAFEKNKIKGGARSPDIGRFQSGFRGIYNILIYKTLKNVGSSNVIDLTIVFFTYCSHICKAPYLPTPWRKS